MRIGVCFDSLATTPEMVDLARLADELGLDSVWMADHIGLREAFTVSAALLAGTSRIKVCPVAINPYSRHPAVTAMAAATLDELGPGRVILSVGMGNTVDLADFGMATTRPVTAVREMILILRELFREGRCTYRGEVLQVPHARLGVRPSAPIPIYIAAMGPAMLRLAGEVGDGVVLSAGSSPEFIREARERVAEGARKRGDGGAATVTSLVLVSMGDSERAAVAASKPLLAWVLRGRHHAPNMRAAGTGYDRETAIERIRKGDWEGAGALISDELVHKHSVSGTREGCAERLRAYTAGLDLPIVLPVGDRDRRREILRLSRTLA